jgi:hypothetical protein
VQPFLFDTFEGACLTYCNYMDHPLAHSLAHPTHSTQLAHSLNSLDHIAHGPSLTNSHPPTLTCFGLHPLCGRYGISEKDGLRNCYLEAGRRCDSGEHRTAHVYRNLCMCRTLSTVGPQARTDKKERT